MSNSSAPLVMGIYLGHDPSCCLMRGGKVEFVIEEERINRFKHGRPRSLGGLWPRFAGRFGYFPWASVSYVLTAAGCELTDLDLIVVGDDQWAKAARDTIADVIPVLDKSRVVYTDLPRDSCHHFHHALGSFFMSPFDEAAVLIVDGDGNTNSEGYEAETGFVMHRGGAWDQIFKNRYRETSPPRSGIGWMYEQVSYVLGYGNHEIGLAEPGKTMGLSSYGEPCNELSEPWIATDGFRLDFSGFKRWMQQTGYDRLVFGRNGGIAARSREPSTLAQNIAYKVQVETEQAIIHLARRLRAESRSANLCIGGGVALNSVANGKLVRENIFSSVHILPAVHDGGQSIGLAVHGHLLLTTNFNSGLEVTRRMASRPIEPLTSAYLGREYGDDETRTLLAEFGLGYAALNDREVAESASDALAAGKFIGWFQGRSEIGPRALGNRSILAAAGSSQAKDALNARVKFRESFRPFAPAVLSEVASEVFDIEVDSPYMLLVADVRNAWKERIPAVVHVDGTARLQSVYAQTNPRFHALISAVAKRTGVPVVLNTSFNLAGMPIVEAPIDAIHCFLQTQLDELYVGNLRVLPPSPTAVTYAIKTGWKIEAAIAGSDSLTITAPDRTSIQLDCVHSQRRALALIDGHRSFAEICDRSESVLSDLDALLKRLVRHGTLELRIGSRCISNTRSDTSWDKTLYEGT